VGKAATSCSTRGPADRRTMWYAWAARRALCTARTRRFCCSRATTRSRSVPSLQGGSSANPLDREVVRAEQVVREARVGEGALLAQVQASERGVDPQRFDGLGEGLPSPRRSSSTVGFRWSMLLMRRPAQPVGRGTNSKDRLRKAEAGLSLPLSVSVRSLAQQS
jgi:hypothetical protein